MSNKEAVQRAMQILRSNRYLTLATCSGGDPWATPLAYVLERDNLSFLYYSAREARHQQIIRDRARVACAIFDSTAPSDTADGVQFAGTVHEVSNSELPAVMQFYFEQSFPAIEVRQRWQRPVEDFTGEAPQRFYRIIPQEMFVPDLTEVKIDRRVTVDLTELRSQLGK